MPTLGPLSLRRSIQRLRDRWMLASMSEISVRALIQQFQPLPASSVRALLLKMKSLADQAKAQGGSLHPYYRRAMPQMQDPAKFDGDGTHIDFRNALPAFGDTDNVPPAVAGFDARAAAVVRDTAKADFIFNAQKSCLHNSPLNDMSPAEGQAFLHDALLEQKAYGDDAPTIYILRPAALAMMAYQDYFPDDPTRLFGGITQFRDPSLVVAAGYEGQPIGAYLRDMVNVAILQASPGWCGVNGPDATVISTTGGFGGDYDMTQMHLIHLAYSYYDELAPAARDHLINQLLARGRIHRPGDDDDFTNGGVPTDWRLAGSRFGNDVPETENHILCILTARYLTNQLLFQQDGEIGHDNRRNGGGYRPNCTDLVLTQLRNALRCDFSEYNAKNYQEETRWALLNLCTYAYEQQVRLAARMVLDYISAHIAVSSNDLRRMVPFRRRNETKNVTRVDGFMTTGLLETALGADPMAPYFAIQAGNLRAYQTSNPDLDPNGKPPLPARPWVWAIAQDGGDMMKEVLSRYRLPPLIHDLFVNDLHRRFFQRLHRTPQVDEEEGARNCDNMEIYAGSPSYLISAGGEPATYALDPGSIGAAVSDQTQQIGVAVPTSFMPTGQSAGPSTQNMARDLIQLCRFSDDFDAGGEGYPATKNYGVAPDFVCGLGIHLPQWAVAGAIPPFSDAPGFHFVNQGSDGTSAGFYLAIYQDGDFALLEAFDTWLRPNVTFCSFMKRVLDNNGQANFRFTPSLPESGVEEAGQYVTFNGMKIDFLIWKDHTQIARPDAAAGAKVNTVDYSPEDVVCKIGDAGNVTDRFLNGTILNSLGTAVTAIGNPGFADPAATITLDMGDRDHPRRVSETGAVEQSGLNNEVWVKFGYTGPSEGDFFHPFSTVAAAIAAVADGGVIRIMPGWTTERPTFARGKRYRLTVALDAAAIGVL